MVTTSRRSFLTMTGAMTLGAALAGAETAAPAMAPKTLASPNPDRPNVVVIMVDQIQVERMRLWGGKDLKTPHIDRIAAEGALFREAFTTAPVCTPSRQSFWTGRFASTFGGAFNGVEMPDEVVHLPRLLKDVGYTNVVIGKNHCFHPEKMAEYFDREWPPGKRPAPPPPDLEQKMKEFTRDAQHEFVRLAHGRIVDAPSEVTGAARTTRAALTFLENQTSQPFFTWISYSEPHSPYITTREYADRYNPDKLTLPKSWRCSLKDKPAHLRELHDLMDCDKLTEADIRQITQIYYGIMSQVDDGIGQILAALENKGILDNTIVVFTSDHGEYMGNQDMLQKSAHCYDALIRVPLMIRWPKKVKPGTVIDDLVQHYDVMPTLCAWLGLPLPRDVEAMDLTPAIEGTNQCREAVFSEIGFHADRELTKEKTHAPDLPWKEAQAFYHFVFGHYAQRALCVRTKTHKLVVYEYGERELYDLKKDPEEMVNLYGRKKVAAIQQRLEDILLDRLLASANPAPDLMTGWSGDGLRDMLKKQYADIPDAK